MLSHPITIKGPREYFEPYEYPNITTESIRLVYLGQGTTIINQMNPYYVRNYIGCSPILSVTLTNDL